MKITENFIKEKITEWLNKCPVEGYQGYAENYQKHIEELYSQHQYPLEINSSVWEYFSNGENWVSDSNPEKCEDGDQDTDTDEVGLISPKLQTCDIEKCTKYIFIPENLPDSHRIEIITDEVNEEVLMWSIIVD